MGKSINVDVDYYDHLKTRRLMNLLTKGSELLPLKLWAYVGRHKPESGRLDGHSVQEIEAIMGWWGAPGVAVAAMLTVKFLDLDADGVTYVVHDWLDHNGHLHAFKVRAKAAADARWNAVKPGRRSRPPDATSNAQASGKQCSNGTSSTNPPVAPAGGGRGRADAGGEARAIAEALP